MFGTAKIRLAMARKHFNAISMKTFFFCTIEQGSAATIYGFAILKL